MSKGQYHAQLGREPGVVEAGVQRTIEARDLVPRTVKIVRHEVDKVDKAAVANNRI